MTYATLTGTTLTLTFPLAAAEGLRHAITLAIHERPTSERDMLASIYGALVNPQPARAAPRTENERRDGMRGLREVAGREGARPEPVDVLAVMDSCTDELEKQPGCYYTDAAKLQEARAAIAELIEAASAAEFNLTREHRAPMTVDAADYVTEVERDRNKLRAAIARISGGAQ